MTLFQYILLAALAGLVGITWLCLYKTWLGRRSAVFFTLLWTVGALAVAWPDFTSVVARTMGIGRGADLVMYSAVFLMTVGFFMVFVRLRRLRRTLTLMVRNIAILDAQGPTSIGRRASEGSSGSASAEAQSG